jgi:hypothetical protein
MPTFSESVSIERQINRFLHKSDHAEGREVLLPIVGSQYLQVNCATKRLSLFCFPDPDPEAERCPSQSLHQDELHYVPPPRAERQSDADLARSLSDGI